MGGGLPGVDAGRLKSGKTFGQVLYRKSLQLPDLRSFVVQILDVIREEAKLLCGPQRIILGGISQGAATAIHALLRGGVRLGGFVGLCGWLPLMEELETVVHHMRAPAGSAQRAKDALDGIATLLAPTAGEARIGDLADLQGQGRGALATPVFLGHSRDDEMVPVACGEGMRGGLERLGMGVAWRVYADGGHRINEPAGVDDLVEFLGKCARSRRVMNQ